MFDVRTAQRYAREGRIEEWVQAYLAAGEWANPGLADGLRLQRRWWNGPLELSLDDLARCVGPEPDMEYPDDPRHWAERTARMAATFTDPLAIPPLIAMYDCGALSVRDGNTRHEALRRRGWRTCWAIIWYNSEEEHRAHTRELVAQGRLGAEAVGHD